MLLRDSTSAAPPAAGAPPAMGNIHSFKAFGVDSTAWSGLFTACHTGQEATEASRSDSRPRDSQTLYKRSPAAQLEARCRIPRAVRQSRCASARPAV